MEARGAVEAERERGVEGEEEEDGSGRRAGGRGGRTGERLCQGGGDESRGTFVCFLSFCRGSLG